VDDPRLHGITLVDTPGTGGVIEEHQNRTVEYINLYNDLRQRHDQETRQIGSQADALVFLIGATARAREQEFLEQFRNLTGVGQTPVLNAVGVLAKADMYEEGSGRRHELAATIARQLKTELNTVVPISAGVHAAIKRLCANNRADLDLLVRSLRQLPKDQLEVLLADEGLYLDESAIPNCVLSVQERRSLYHEMEWGVFKAIARAATQDHASVAEVAVTLEDLAGFGPLLKVLKEHILDRAQILRCHNLIAQAVRAVNEIKYTHLPESRREAKENRGRLDRFLSWLQTTHGDDQQVRSELETFLRQALSGTEGLTNRERLLGEFDAAVSKLSQQLIRYNDDFNAVRVLLDNKEQFSAAELDELSALYGLRGTDLRIRLAGVSATVEYIGGRQQFWRMEAEHNTRRGSARYLVAERADAAYGALLYDITGAEGMREGQSY
jgi:hypothetical protein